MIYRALPWLLLASLVAVGCATNTAPKPAMRQHMSPAPVADLVFAGGEIHTMDATSPTVEAVAVKDGRVLAVGSAAQIKPLIGAGTRTVDLKGRAMTPGLVDAHAHLLGLGSALEILDLRDVSRDALVEKIAAAAKSKQKGEWILGRGWDQTRWTDNQFPTAALLDAVSADNPVALRRVDGHALVANSAAMTAAGITKATTEPPGGKIHRAKNGAPNGLFVDAAMALIESKVPEDSEADIERKIQSAAQVAISAGLTGVHEMGINDKAVAVYRKLAAAGKLPLRVYAFYGGDRDISAITARKPDRDDTGDAYFTLRGIKLYADGALGSRGAALLAPYSDSDGETGLLQMTEEELNAAAAAAVAGGWQLGVHAIGDRANRMVLDAFAAATAGVPDHRFRIEHAQIVAIDDLARFHQLGVIASMQMTHATSDMRWAEERVGADRIKGAYAWRKLLDSGAHLAGGSDFPVEQVSPLLGLYAGITRQDADGNPPGGWMPGERMTLEEVIAAFTKEAAYASFLDHHRGTIAKGYVADFTVYDRKLDGGPGLLQTNIDMTVVGGTVVYERNQ